MMRYMSAELQKMKRTFLLKILWIGPFIALICAYGGGQSSGYYFWYSTLLPGVLTIISAMVIQKDAKMKYRSVFSFPVNKSKIWSGKIMACCTLFLTSCIIFTIGVSCFDFIPRYLTIEHILLTQIITASVLLFITSLWQIPFCMFLSAKFGVFVTVILNIAANIIGGAEFAGKSLWCVFPYGITVREMCPILHILPNGLPVPKGSPLLSSSVIMPGVLISLVFFALIWIFTAAWFERQEVK